MGSWNQLVPSNKGKVSCSKKQRGPLMGLEPTTSTLPVRRATHCVTPPLKIKKLNYYDHGFITCTKCIAFRSWAIDVESSAKKAMHNSWFAKVPTRMSMHSDNCISDLCDGSGSVRTHMRFIWSTCVLKKSLSAKIIMLDIVFLWFPDKYDYVNVETIGTMYHQRIDFHDRMTISQGYVVRLDWNRYH